MLPRINKILYATDLSDNSAYALRYALNSAIKHDAVINILHVFELISTTNRFAKVRRISHFMMFKPILLRM